VADVRAGQDAVQLDPAQLDSLVGRFGACAGELRAIAGGVDRGVPEIPEDEHGIGRRLVELDEARERADRWVADAFETLSQRLAVLGLTVGEADHFVTPPGP
jgi:hypothetical protein